MNHRQLATGSRKTMFFILARQIPVFNPGGNHKPQTIKHKPI
jgi:hypothetical protein